MNLNLRVKSKTGSGSKNFLIEINAAKLERLAAGLGFFNKDFLKSLAKAEKDLKAGRVRKIKSLKELAKKSR